MKKIVFVAVTVVLFCVVTEVIGFMAISIFDGRMFSHGRIAEEIGGATKGTDGVTAQGPRQPATISMVPHPYVGYVYPPTLNGPEFQSYHLHPVNAHGFVDSNPPVRRRDERRVIIGVLGASVAYWFSALGDQTLIQELRKSPHFADKEIEIVRLALGSMKQPQQLMTLNWVLSLGGEFDIILNIDGYNEAMIPEPENLRAGMHPHYPRFWNLLMQGTPSQEFLRLVGTVVKAKDDRRAWAGTYDRSWMSKSMALGFVWKVRDRQLAVAVAHAQEALNRYVPPAQAYAAVGAGVADYPPPLEGEVVDYWRRCSELLDQVCAARGILYLHFLQPNQYIGKKPMGHEEKAIVSLPDRPAFIPMLQRTYAAMIDAGATMRAVGLRFHDLTPIFEAVHEQVYNDNCCHMNQLGNEIMARHVGQAILDAWASWRRPPVAHASDVAR